MINLKKIGIGLIVLIAMLGLFHIAQFIGHNILPLFDWNKIYEYGLPIFLIICICWLVGDAVLKNPKDNDSEE